MTLPKGYKPPIDDDRSNKSNDISGRYLGDSNNIDWSRTSNPSVKGPLVKFIVGIVIAIALVAFIVVTASGIGKTNNALSAAHARVEAAGYDVLEACMKTLPIGTDDCDRGMNQMMQSCIETNSGYSYCGDPRISQYVHTVSN